MVTVKLKYPGAAALDAWRSAQRRGDGYERDDHGAHEVASRQDNPRRAQAARPDGLAPFVGKDVPPAAHHRVLHPVLAAASGEVANHHALFGAVEQGQARVAQIRRAVHAGPVTGLISQVLLLAALALTFGLGRTGWVIGVSCAVIMNATLAHGVSHYRSAGLGAADWVTLSRATLAVGVLALVAQSFDQPTSVVTLVSLTALALTLDAVDGWVARRTRTAAALGARFDGEVDAFLVLVLSVYVARSYGAWVLAIGAARYTFLAAGWPLAWMRAPLPPRYWRKVVAATQGIVLAIAAADIVPLALSRAFLVVALALLSESFGRDVWWLWIHRAATHSPVVAGADRSADAKLAAPADTRRGRPRATVAAVFTILALLVVWAALVAPDQPSALTPTAFVRVPLEGLVLIALAVILPATGRRILAGVVGPALALLVILKILDIAFFTAFARPFDLIGDAGDAGIGIETLRAALGSTEANLLIVGGVALAVCLLVLITLATLRLMRVAAGNRRWSLGAVAALGAVWLLCSVSGAQLLSHTPIASTSTSGFLVHEVGTVEADIHDEAVFANQIRHDPFRSTPGDRLLTGLRGKDVLLVFVESYGQVSVQGSSFSPGIDALLNKGTRQLRDAGFSARSAFVNAPGFGGISWLAHSTLQSGVWANNQRRYDQLVATDRFTLSDAFGRAGWRTINFAPADDRSWPEGSSFYHYDKLYDRRDMGYRGPSFNYAPMPDQYMFAALQRLELAKAHRRPLFAEVDTVSSHMPWDRIPQMVPWNDLGNGSIFNRIPMDRESSSFWWHPNQVKAAYARSLEYSLNTLISFVQHYGKKNLVLVVVGDEQPLGIVSGPGASHDVPISVIAHDPSVLKRIGAWSWESGFLPRPDAPVWRMSAFRNRFLTAYGPQPAGRQLAMNHEPQTAPMMRRTP
jgi:phosphatidylglycerophosphate synthase